MIRQCIGLRLAFSIYFWCYHCCCHWVPCLLLWGVPCCFTLSFTDILGRVYSLVMFLLPFFLCPRFLPIHPLLVSLVPLWFFHPRPDLPLYFCSCPTFSPFHVAFYSASSLFPPGCPKDPHCHLHRCPIAQLCALEWIASPLHSTNGEIERKAHFASDNLTRIWDRHWVPGSSSGWDPAE